MMAKIIDTQQENYQFSNYQNYQNSNNEVKRMNSGL